MTVPNGSKGCTEVDEPDLIASYFLGPKAQNAGLWGEMLTRVYDDYVHWRRNYFPRDKSIITRGDQRDPRQLAWVDQLSLHLDEVLDHLKADYPFYSPRYIAHMLSDQTLPGCLGLFAGTLYNPNNVTDEAAPVTVRLELEVGGMLAKMLGFDSESASADERPWGHLTSGGTIATIEALWVARQAQFLPLIVAHCCESEDFRREIGHTLAKRDRHLSDAARTVIESDAWSHFRADRLDGRDLTCVKELLAVPPDRQLRLLPDLRQYLADRLLHIEKATMKAAVLDLTEFLLEALYRSPYNPARQGYASAIRAATEAGATDALTAVVFAPETAHYCLAKACNVLGYGEAGLKLVPVDDKFRLRADKLKEKLAGLSSGEYVAAVVVLAGTTEEGAVDPIHEIAALRDEATSFWLHVDAAWGGYVACVFDRTDDGDLVRTDPDGRLRVTHLVGKDTLPGIKPRDIWIRDEDRSGEETRSVEWGHDGQQDHLKDAFGAIRHADSVVIDPHKLGYVPYPSGAVVFRNQRTTLLTGQTASYIGAGRRDKRDILEAGATTTLESVGPYVLEGSKPGSAASAAWLAHTSIPLNKDGHGHIIGQTLLAAQKLAGLLKLLDSDAQFNQRYEADSTEISSGQDDRSPLDAEAPHRFHLGFRLVTEPDTNVVTFLVRPLQVKVGDPETLEPVRWSLAELNSLNRAIYSRMGKPRGGDEVTRQQAPEAPFPYGHPFFISRTEMRSSRQPDGHYSFLSVEDLLKDLLPGTRADHAASYDGNADGVFALRCTVMNPYYHLAEMKKEDYIVKFVKELYGVGLTVLRQFTERLASYVLVRCDPDRAENVRNALAARPESVRRAVVVKRGGSREPRVLLEVRALLDTDVKLADEIRQLGYDHIAEGVVGTETFVRTEGNSAGVVSGDDNPVYVFLNVEVGQTPKVLKDILGIQICSGGLEARIITGRYDIAVAVSGMEMSAAKAVVGRIKGLQYVMPRPAVFWPV